VYILYFAYTKNTKYLLKSISNKIQNTFRFLYFKYKYKIHFGILNTYFKYMYFKYSPALAATHIENLDCKSDRIEYTCAPSIRCAQTTLYFRFCSIVYLLSTTHNMMSNNSFTYISIEFKFYFHRSLSSRRPNCRLLETALRKSRSVVSSVIAVRAAMLTCVAAVKGAPCECTITLRLQTLQSLNSHHVKQPGTRGAMAPVCTASLIHTWITWR
jgi:hypothetical protein